MEYKTSRKSNHTKESDSLCSVSRMEGENNNNHHNYNNQKSRRLSSTFATTNNFATNSNNRISEETAEVRTSDWVRNQSMDFISDEKESLRASDFKLLSSKEELDKIAAVENDQQKQQKLSSNTQCTKNDSIFDKPPSGITNHSNNNDTINSISNEPLGHKLSRGIPVKLNPILKPPSGPQQPAVKFSGSTKRDSNSRPKLGLSHSFKMISSDKPPLMPGSSTNAVIGLNVKKNQKKELKMPLLGSSPRPASVKIWGVIRGLQFNRFLQIILVFYSRLYLICRRLFFTHFPPMESRYFLD